MVTTRGSRNHSSSFRGHGCSFPYGSWSVGRAVVGTPRKRAGAAGLRVALPRQRPLAPRRDRGSLRLPRLREAQLRTLPGLVQAPLRGRKGWGGRALGPQTTAIAAEVLGSRRHRPVLRAGPCGTRPPAVGRAATVHRAPAGERRTVLLDRVP